MTVHISSLYRKVKEMVGGKYEGWLFRFLSDRKTEDKIEQQNLVEVRQKNVTNETY